MALEIQTFPPFPMGMYADDAAHAIPDGAASYIQDFVVHEPGFAVQRGPFKRHSTITLTIGTATPAALVPCPDYATGALRLAIVYWDATQTAIALLADNYTDAVPKTYTLTTLGYKPIATWSPCIRGGVLIGVMPSYERTGSNPRRWWWLGANKATYSTGTITANLESASVVGVGTSWTANVEPGMFLMESNERMVGIVKSVESNTTLTLENPSRVTVAGVSYTIDSMILTSYTHSKGTITVADAGTSVFGSKTRWKESLETYGSGNIRWLRKFDYSNIGADSSITNNQLMTLTAGSSTALVNEEYVAFVNNFDLLPNTADTKYGYGYLMTEYAERQWYANQPYTGATLKKDQTSIVWFSELGFHDAVDWYHPAGDFIPIADAGKQKSPIMGIYGLDNGLIVLKRDCAYVITGKVPEQFSPNYFWSDGCISVNSMQPYENGLIWAGFQGIYFTDGQQVTNLLEDSNAGKMNDFYTHCLDTFVPGPNDTTAKVVGSVIYKDHYFLYVKPVTPPRGYLKNQTLTTPTTMTFCVNLRTKAVTLMSNVAIYCGVQLPPNSGHDALALTAVTSGTPQINFIDLEALLPTGDISTNDNLVGVGETSGPDPYIESKKYDAGDPQIKKLWKQLQLHYQSDGGTLSLNTVVGLNDTGALSGSTFADSDNSFVDKRIKFLKRSQFFQFRLYRTSSSTVNIWLGPFALGFKYQRKGRV